MPALAKVGKAAYNPPFLQLCCVYWLPLRHLRMTFDTTLLGILLATALSGIGSMAGAAALSLTVLSRMVDRMVSFSVGVLLAT